MANKVTRQLLDAHDGKKFIRVISILIMASNILGKAEAKKWLYTKIPSLGNKVPFNLLDTEAGHCLVEQALLKIKHGLYA